MTTLEHPIELSSDATISAIDYNSHEMDAPEQVEADHIFGKERDSRSEIYGSFWINKTEFALPVRVVQEVVNEPEGYAPVPLSPPHMLGIFYLRGAVIPVIDLRVLLGFSEPENKGRRKVAIVEHGDLCIGLLFDDTGGVIYGDGTSRVMFEANSEGNNDVVIEGMLKLDDGARAVQLLDPYRLLKIQHIPRVAKAACDLEAKSNLGRRQNCIAFQIGHTHCAIELKHVQEIMDVPEILESPLAHGHILGNIDLRGHTVPVVDFRGVLEEKEPFKFLPETLSHRKLVVLCFPAGQIALLVYSVDSIVSYFESDVLPFGRVPIPRRDMIKGCLIREEEEIVILFDFERLQKDPDLVRAAQSCREIFPPEVEIDNPKDTVAAEKSAGRRNFIIFSVGERFALDVAYVSEVLNRPTNLLTPPFALRFVDGVYSLRGELVPLINVRKLYGLPEKEEAAAKVLIFQAEGGKYGLLVDSIDEIMRTTGNNFLTAPSFKREASVKTISEDVVGCLNVPGDNMMTHPALVLNIPSLMARCLEVK